MYYNNWTNTFYGLFYLVVNLIQTSGVFPVKFLTINYCGHSIVPIAVATVIVVRKGLF